MSDPVSLPTRLDALRAALHELMAQAQWVGESDEVLVAVQEAVVNAANHGCGVREVAARVGGTELVVEIADHGEGFDPTGYLAHPPDVLAEAGRGLWLMGQIATEVELSHEPDGARVRLRFTTGEADDGSVAAPSAVPSLDSLGMKTLEAFGGAVVLVDTRLVVREAAGAVETVLHLEAQTLPGKDIRGVVAELKDRFADPAGFESAMLDLLAQPEREVEEMWVLTSGQFLRQQAAAVWEAGEVVGRLLLFMPAAAHTEAQAAFQRALMPSVPDVDGLALGATYHPAEASWLVGGDFYDSFELPAGHGVVVGDVSGRGPYAAAAGVTARAYLRATLTTSGVTGAVPAINRALCHELDVEQFVTMAMVNRESVDVWTLTLCGHPPPLLYRDGHVTSFRSRGMVLGVYEDQEWSRQLFHLNPGDVLLLYTDGVTEAGSPSDQFGITRLAKALEELAHQPPQQLVETIDARLHSFAGGDMTDDHVLMAVSRL